MDKKSLKITPMLQQYLEIKEQYQDAILFYRMGDFYEMFFDDATTASRVLGITLTSRSHKDDENRVPMCGVPYHAVSGYLGKMVNAGYKVAICEQTEDPSQAKGIVKREVVRVVTPGITTDEQLLDEKNNLYICALAFTGSGKKQRTAGLSFLDVSTGTFLLSEQSMIDGSWNPILDEIARMGPAELLISEETEKQDKLLLETLQNILGGLCKTIRPDSAFDYSNARSLLTEHFRTKSLAGFGCESFHAATCAAGALLSYIQETQKTDLSYIKKLRAIDHGEFLVLDESSRRNLELIETIVGGQRQGSLLGVLDLTCTPMGARLLRQNLLFPLQERKRILNRQNIVENFLADNMLRRELRQTLDAVYDLERLCSRLVLGHGNARDMTALKISLAQLPVVKDLLSTSSTGQLRTTGNQLDLLDDLHELIEKTIREDAPITLREGNLIKEKYSQELDELIALDRNGKEMILAIEQQERQRTGIAKLKVGYNKIFGYFLEVSRAQSAAIPDDYIRKQTLVNAERFITPELKELENKVSTAQEKRLELEYSLFLDIRNRIASQSERILAVASDIAKMDFLACLAEVAARYHYCRPTITTEDEIAITEGRHPVIERSLDFGRFVPNDIFLNQVDHELLIITGPNMAGKSTVLRQTALIVLLAHIGSFVPADSARICLVDRIFTRVGAMDNLRLGQSTFMVEMNETANILNNATDRSLVILDEIGRGTSTYDGLSIAWAVAEELAEKNGRGVKTLFATHYHELTDLALTNHRIKNYSIAVREWNDSIIFLHKLIQGATNRSYGIQVAGLAGVPEKVVKRAHEILKNIEKKEYTQNGQPVLALSGMGKKIPKQPIQIPLFRQPADPLKKLLQDNHPDHISPKEALLLLYKVHELLGKNEVA